MTKIYNRLIPEGRNAVADIIKKRMQENRQKAIKVANQEHRVVDETVSDLEMYRYLGMTFPDSPFGNIIK